MNELLGWYGYRKFDHHHTKTAINAKDKISQAIRRNSSVLFDDSENTNSATSHMISALNSKRKAAMDEHDRVDSSSPDDMRSSAIDESTVDKQGL